MNEECKYVESTEYGNYCCLLHKSCDNPSPNNDCEEIEAYWKYLTEIGVEVASEEDIVESWMG